MFRGTSTGVEREPAAGEAEPRDEEVQDAADHNDEPEAVVARGQDVARAHDALAREVREQAHGEADEQPVERVQPDLARFRQPVVHLEDLDGNFVDPSWYVRATLTARLAVKARVV